ncbi:MAG: hypothetical protein HYY59_02095 [Candidatus Omnitrophica bacterium]|nr:hypothetical protein [Candidatus Omnitrophota bacterium]MBI3020775.1 hypothetical protein [Candidatus Omnitrophota bacterium]
MAQRAHPDLGSRAQSAEPRAPRALSRGQALVELAVFGSVLLLLLGVLLNYGLNAEYNQQAMMEAFRRALSLAPGPGKSSVTVIRDRYIPNPSNPFALGSVYPVAVSARVTKDPRMHETADTVEELPRLSLFVNTRPESQTPTRSYTTEGFRSGSSREVDPCEGEIMDPDLCRARCREDASPWYCSKLDQLFQGINKMSVQPGMRREARVNASLRKEESPSALRTTTHMESWRDRITRRVVSRRMGDESGRVGTEEIATTPKDVAPNDVTWTTPWN